MNRIEQLEKELKRAEDRQRDIPRQLEELKAKADKLRARRTELLAGFGLGEAAAIEEVHAIERQLMDMLRERQRTNEVNVELDCLCQSLNVKLLRTIVTEELSQLPKLANILTGAVREIGKAVAGIDFSGIRATSLSFNAPPLSSCQQMEAMLRDEIGKSLSQAVALQVSDPQRPLAVNCGEIEAILRKALQACDLRDDQVKQHLERARQYQLLERQKAEATTAL
jgi:hypothetical protein